MASDAEVATAIRVLKAAMEDESLREKLQPAVGLFNRRARQRQRQQAAAKEGEASDRAAAAPPAVSAGGVVRIAPPHLSRPLYPNPVCFLSTWAAAGGRRRNLMTISWLSPIDNDGRFFCSMNQRRHSARLLAANPVFALSVACAGLEPLLLRAGGCSGARAGDKPAALGVPLCRPGWAPLPAEEPAAADEAAESSAVEEAGWPAEGEVELAAPAGQPSAEAGQPSGEHDDALANAFAVAPCVAHVCARVLRVRGAHGHYLLAAETLSAHVRAEYWSGKTLERQREGLPPVLSFVGSQRFCRLQDSAESGAGVGAESGLSESAAKELEHCDLGPGGLDP